MATHLTALRSRIPSPTQKKNQVNQRLALGNKTCLLGTPDTSRSGRNTRKARRALTSKPPDLPLEWLPPSVSLVNCSRITLNNLKKKKKKKKGRNIRGCHPGKEPRRIIVVISAQGLILWGCCLCKGEAGQRHKSGCESQKPPPPLT